MNANIRRMGMALLAATALGAFMAAPQAAQAQWRRDRDTLGRFGREYGAQARKIVERLERDSNAFRDAFEHHGWDDRRSRDDRRYRDDRSRGWDRNEDLRSNVQRFDEGTERLRRDFGRSDYYLDTRAQISDVLRMARPIDRAMDDRRFSSMVVDRWHRVAADLDALATIFGLGRL